MRSRGTGNCRCTAIDLGEGPVRPCIQKIPEHEVYVRYFCIGHLLFNKLPCDLVLQFPKQCIDGTVVEIKGVAVDHDPLCQFFNGDILIIHSIIMKQKASRIAFLVRRIRISV